MGNAQHVLSAGLEFFFAVVSVILLIGCLLDHVRNSATNRIVIAILAIFAVMNAADACIWLYCDVPSLLPLMKVLTFLSYALSYAVPAMFTFLMICYIGESTPAPDWISRVVIAWSIFVAIMLVVSLFNDMYYYWDENGICQIGELNFLGQIYGIVIIIFNMAIVLAYRKELGKRVCCIFTLYHVLPLISYLFMPLWDVVPLSAATTISLLIYYIVIHLDHGRKVAEQQVRIAQQELALNNSRTAMMLTQIQPHFLYNSLTAIAQLCEHDPKKAKETTLHFSEYMRQNMRSLEQKEPVPFDMELKHVKTYSYIEQVRFGKKLNVEYDIQASDFLLPSLCLQPIVENAIKHGVSAKEAGGTVTISTRETPDGFEITVSDDGIGFDAERMTEDGKSHIGLQNVRERLSSMIGATLDVESQIGIGTKATILIHK